MEKVNNFQQKISLLKAARLQILSLHKALLDLERDNYEKVNGALTSGQFLNLLINDLQFQWLRKFSTLIVEIDEMLSLNDGFTENMIDRYISQMHKLIDLDSMDNDFKEKYVSFLHGNIGIARKHNVLLDLLTK